jgi:hypothetical protein
VSLKVTEAHNPIVKRARELATSKCEVLHSVARDVPNGVMKNEWRKTMQEM